MTIFLEKVPLEIRNQIYEEILISKESAIRLRIQKAPFGGHRNKIHSAVLRTCKQIYDEASIVLFEHNRFRYASYSPAWLNFLEHDPRYRNLKRIKHVSTSLSLPLRTDFGDQYDQLDLVNCGEIKGSRYYETDSPYHRPGDRYHDFVAKLTPIMMFLSNAGCSLQTLRLRFYFTEATSFYEDVIRYADCNEVPNVWISETQVGPISARYIQDKVDRVLNSFRAEYNRTMEEFTKRVCMAKERALMVDIEKGTIKEDGEFLDMWTKFGQIDSQMESRYIGTTYHYRWTWTLRPLTSITKGVSDRVAVGG